MLGWISGSSAGAHRDPQIGRAKTTLWRRSDDPRAACLTITPWGVWLDVCRECRCTSPTICTTPSKSAVCRLRSCCRKPCAQKFAVRTCSLKLTDTSVACWPRSGSRTRRSTLVLEPWRDESRGERTANSAEYRAGARFECGHPTCRPFSIVGRADPCFPGRRSVAAAGSFLRPRGVPAGARWSRRRGERLSQDLRHRGRRERGPRTACGVPATPCPPRIRRRCTCGCRRRTRRDCPHVRSARS